jgi:hypothetical protein
MALTLLASSGAAIAGELGNASANEGPGVRSIGNRRELFVDHWLIEELKGAALVLHTPRDEGKVLAFDQPWEGPFCAYTTVIHDGGRYRLYYRGMPRTGDLTDVECTCYAESSDGIHWIRPRLGLFEVAGTKANNVILAHSPPFSHNFSPFLDTRPNVPGEQRFKALAGSRASGLCAFVSADGVHWRKLQDDPVLKDPSYAFDSQNVSFWSDAEGKYVCYFRTFEHGVRWISRATSADFLHWTRGVSMKFEHGGRPAPVEHLYTNQTHPYFRAKHLYVATPARFLPGRQVLNDEQAKAIGVHPGYFRDCSDAVFMTSRGGAVYDRTFLEGFVRPGIGYENWVSRTNYPALNVVQTGPTEMSLYVQHNYGQPTAHLRRYSLRLDGFASVRAPYVGGELLTGPFVFSGRRLLLNFATSAAGGIKVELRDRTGRPLPGYGIDDCQELIGNEIERASTWKNGTDLSSLAGQPIRLRFVLKDADLFALRFE